MTAHMNVGDDSFLAKLGYGFFVGAVVIAVLLLTLRLVENRVSQKVYDSFWFFALMLVQAVFVGAVIFAVVA